MQIATSWAMYDNTGKYLDLIADKFGSDQINIVDPSSWIKVQGVLGNEK